MRRLGRREVLALGAAGLLQACGFAAAPPPVATVAPGERATATARQAEVALRLTATAEARAATATVRAAPTPTATATPLPPTPTPRPPTPTPPRAAAALVDFAMATYQGSERLGGDRLRFSSAFAAEQPVVANFWAPLCGPCRVEMPAFGRIADEFADRIVFLGVDISPYWPGFGERDDARALIRELGLRYPLAYATESPLEGYRLRAIPTTYFFAPDASVVGRVATVLSEQQLRESVGKLLAATKASRPRRSA